MKTWEPKYKTLGYQNGWKETPELVKDCHHKEDIVVTYLNSRHTHKQICCSICMYIYYVDSGD